MSIRIFCRSLGIGAMLWNAFAAQSVLAAATADVSLPPGCEIATPRAGAKPAMKSVESVFPPVQLQIRTPVAPIPFPSGGRNYLVYELHLQNFAGDPLTLRGIEVTDADNGAEKLIAEFKEAHLHALLRPVGIESDDHRRLGGGQGAVAFLCLAFDGTAAVPGKLRHRVLLNKSTADGPVIEVRRTALPVLGPPVVGDGWNARNGPHIDSHHRMGLLVAGGLPQISRRYAIDWRKSKQGAPLSGDARDLRSYYTYGEKLLAVADGTVVVARDGFPDNVPRTEAGFETAVPVTLETVGGNMVVIDLGNGLFASYAHMQPGSVRVKAGDRVKRGRLLGRIGNSGDSRWPHLHFQVTTTPDLFDSEGVPFLIDRYRAKDGDNAWEMRAQEFPLGPPVLIDFGGSAKEE
jgi:hypothetical protein